MATSTSMHVHRDALLGIMAVRRMNLTELAAASNLSYSLVRALAGGQRATCSAATVEAIARALDVDPICIGTDARLARPLIEMRQAR